MMLSIGASTFSPRKFVGDISSQDSLRPPTSGFRQSQSVFTLAYSLSKGPITTPLARTSRHQITKPTEARIRFFCHSFTPSRTISFRLRVSKAALNYLPISIHRKDPSRWRKCSLKFHLAPCHADHQKGRHVAPNC